MDVFSWLLVGHLVGDWLLQNDWMARGKRRALLTRAGLTHFTIYTAVIIGLLGVSGRANGGWPVSLELGLIIFCSHWLVDATPLVERWMSFYRQSNLELVRVVVDQTLHMLTLLVVAIVCRQGSG